MQHAFDKIFCILNTILNWDKCEEGSFFEAILWQMWDAVEDIQEVLKKYKAELEEKSKALHNAEAEVEKLQKQNSFLHSEAFLFTERQEYDQPDAMRNFIDDLKNCKTKDEIRVVVGNANKYGENDATKRVADILSNFIETEPKSLGDLAGLDDLKEEILFDELVEGVRKRYEKHVAYGSIALYLHKNCQAPVNPNRVIEHLVKDMEIIHPEHANRIFGELQKLKSSE